MVSKVKQKELPVAAEPFAGRQSWLVLVVLVLLFHAVPLFSGRASIQWDAVDVHYTGQKYLIDSIASGNAPYWTPYIFSGFPFLADPQVGAFYPLNWPFLALGASPKMIQAELALHMLLGCAGAFLLLRRFVEKPAAALAGAIAYGGGGFFAGHSSHVGMFQAASLTPWLLLALDRALEGPWVRYAGLGGACGGLMVLAGHFQTTLYSFGALGLFAAARVIEDRQRLAKAAGVLALIVVLAAGLSAVAAWPGLELAEQSVRAGADYGKSDDGSFRLQALATLLFPDSFGVLNGPYTGPGDVTQYYLYAGLLLVPLAAAGARERRARWTGLLLVVPPFWYMLGPSFGLYLAGALVPGLHKVRAPVHGWFVVALGLSVFAAAGAQWALERWKFRWLGWALVTAMVLDLAWHNSWTNPLAYQRASFEETYAAGESLLATRVKPVVPEGTRFMAQDKVAALGPMNSPLQARLETTYGYNPLELKAYSEFRSEMVKSPALESALAPGAKLNAQTGAIEKVTGACPKAWFPKKVTVGGRERLATLQPAEEAVVSSLPGGLRQDGGAQVLSLDVTETRWTMKVKAASNSLLCLSLPWYPAWRFHGKQLSRVDHAFSGVEVPPGVSDVVVEFEPARFHMGALVSAVATLLIGIAIVGKRARPA